MEFEKNNYHDANQYAIRLGEILSDTFKEVSGSELPNERMYYNIAKKVIDPMMKNNFNLISKNTVVIQEKLNKESKIGIIGIEPELNQDRIDGIVQRISDSEKFDDIKWILDEPVINFSQSIVDDAIRENAKFHYESGLHPKIIRHSNAGCCEWCDKLAGVYDYNKVSNTGNEVFRRHRHCRCEVEYMPGDGKVQNVHTKKLKTDKESDIIRQRIKFSEKETKYTPLNYLKNRLDFIDKHTGEKLFIPSGTEAKLVKIIANGKEIRVVNRLVDSYGGRVSNWNKVIANIESEKYKHDVHWYENNGEQYEVKLKYRKEKK